MLIRLFQRLFGGTRDAIALPNFDAGDKAVDKSAAILRECIDLGSAGHDGPNRGRLAKPFARGYLFGFSDACIHRLGALDELESLALITAVHARIFGDKIGSLLVGDALRDQRNEEFGRGVTAGAKDLLYWLDDGSYIPRALTNYLRAVDEATSPFVPSSVSPADSDNEPTRGSSMRGPPRWNTALVMKSAAVEATPERSATIIRLYDRPHAKTDKPLKR